MAEIVQQVGRGGRLDAESPLRGSDFELRNQKELHSEGRWARLPGAHEMISRAQLTSLGWGGASVMMQRRIGCHLCLCIGVGIGRKADYR